MFLTLTGITPQQLLTLQKGIRLKGSIGYSADGTLNFNHWRVSPPEPHTFRRLRHGRITVGDKHIHLRLIMDRQEQANPIQVLTSDASEAMDFLENQIRG